MYLELMQKMKALAFVYFGCYNVIILTSTFYTIPDTCCKNKAAGTTA